MTYPSLLYTGDVSGKKIDTDVFADLKLTNILSGGSIRAAGTICSAHDITARREMFAALQTGKVRVQLRSLRQTAISVSELYKLYRAARCESARDLILVGLLDGVYSFYTAAAGFEGGGELGQRFAGFFSNELTLSHVKRLADALQRARPKIAPCTRGVNCFKIRGETLRVSSATKPTFVGCIRECAVNLGLEEPRVPRADPVGLSANILEGIASLYPDSFNEFAAFYDSQKAFFSPDLLRYIDEISFYLEFCAIFDRATAAGIPLTFPKIAQTRTLRLSNVYDLTLLTKDQTKIIPNDALFTLQEPFFYLTGANGGGKTTYLRAVGVAAVMFSLGCPVACDSAELSIPSGIFTHFPRDERFDSNGRFMDEQRRVDAILAAADENSLVLLNETYSATSEEMAVPMTSSLAERLWKNKIFGIYITHQHGLTQTQIPYLNVVIDASDSNRRTYRVERRRSDGGSYARDILVKYKLTREQLGERFGEV